jgi:alpha-L-fucosidase 2
LLGPKIGRWGQLQEWVEDRDDPDDRHRHTSHLIGVYPGRQISVTETPALAKAAEVSLAARGETGDSRRSWTWPWRCALWARLRKTDAHRMIDGLIQHNLLANLIATHPPLQLDGNFGITAGICEMLLQSHVGELHLLPAVDLQRWQTGSFEGLKARGGFEVSARWRAGRLAEATIRSLLGNPVWLRSDPLPTSVLDAGGAAAGVTTERGAVRFATQPGERYTLRFE